MIFRVGISSKRNWFMPMYFPTKFSSSENQLECSSIRKNMTCRQFKIYIVCIFNCKYCVRKILFKGYGELSDVYVGALSAASLMRSPSFHIRFTYEGLECNFGNALGPTIIWQRVQTHFPPKLNLHRGRAAEISQLSLGQACRHHHWDNSRCMP